MSYHCLLRRWLPLEHVCSRQPLATGVLGRLTPIFILRLLLRRSFSLRAFSNSVYFHFPYSPRTLIYIMRLLLMRRFSFRAFSYDAYFHYASSPMTLTFIPRILLRRLRKKEGAERKSHFGKSLRDPKCKFSKKFAETL